MPKRVRADPIPSPEWCVDAKPLCESVGVGDKRGREFCITAFDARTLTFPSDAGAIYLIYQLEKAPTTETIHLQAFIQFKSMQYPDKVRRLVGAPDAWIGKRIGPSSAAAAYCMKKETRVDPSKPPTIHGTLKVVDKANQGARTDAVAARDAILQKRSWDDVLADSNIAPTLRSSMRWCKEIWERRKRPPMNEAKISLRPWQCEVLERLRRAPSTHIEWYYEPPDDPAEKSGCTGKRFLALYLGLNHGAFVFSASADSQDVFWRVDETHRRIVCLQDRDDQPPRIDLLRTLKAGVWHTGKYEGKQVLRPEPAHVIVLAKQPPAIAPNRRSAVEEHLIEWRES